MRSKLAKLKIYWFFCLLTCCVLGSASAQQRAEGATRTKDSLQALGGAELRHVGPRWSLLFDFPVWLDIDFTLDDVRL